MSRTRTTASLLIALLGGATALTACGGSYTIATPDAASAGAAEAPGVTEATDPPAIDAAEAPSAGYGRPAPTTGAPRTTAPKGKAPAGGKDAGGNAPAATLTISGFSFGSPLTVSRGASVPVRNRDSAPHTATGAGFDTGTVNGGASGTFTAPAAPGTYRFSCQIHPSMTGSITVR